MGFIHDDHVKLVLISAISDYQQCLNNKKHIDTIFLDFAKAFDKVSHSKLCHKLSHYGINGQLLSWIKNYLSDRSQSVVLDGLSIRPTSVIPGAPQGTVLAPLLFLVYINDITTSVNSIIKLYADDVLYTELLTPKMTATRYKMTLINWNTGQTYGQ